MPILFRKTRELERQIDEFLDTVIHGGLLFRQGIKFYLHEDGEEFEKCCRELDGLESSGDRKRRAIEGKLYLETLIPESRGDVLGLLESSDRVLNNMAETLTEFSVQLPDIPTETETAFLNLTDTSISAVESMVMAVRSYLRDPTTVRDHINKVTFYEKEADKVCEKLKRDVFRREEIPLSRKSHLRYFAVRIDEIADSAEDVCDRLAIAVIKRDV